MKNTTGGKFLVIEQNIVPVHDVLDGGSSVPTKKEIKLKLADWHEIPDGAYYIEVFQKQDDKEIVKKWKYRFYKKKRN